MQYIPIVLGTARKGNSSEKVAKFVLSEIKKAGIKSEIVDVKDYRLKESDNSEKSPQAKKWKSKVKKLQKMIIVAPEYNHSYPGELKMFLDMLYLDYAGKKVGIVSTSMGPFAGVLCADKLKSLSVSLNMLPMNKNLGFSMIRDIFNSKGKFKDKKDEKTYTRRTKDFIKNFKKF